MSAEDTIAEKIPDIYFDWYARLMPGVAALVAVAYKDCVHRDWLVEHLTVSIILSYIVGHFMQPLAGGFVKLNECCWGKERHFERYKRRPDSEKSDNAAKKISKAHAESVSMMSATVLLFIVFLYYSQRECHIDLVMLGVVAALFVSCFERMFARRRKIVALFGRA